MNIQVFQPGLLSICTECFQNFFSNIQTTKIYGTARNSFKSVNYILLLLLNISKKVLLIVNIVNIKTSVEVNVVSNCIKLCQIFEKPQKQQIKKIKSEM